MFEFILLLICQNVFYISLSLVAPKLLNRMPKSSAGASFVEVCQNRITKYIVAWPDSIYDSTEAKESTLSLLIKEIACCKFGAGMRATVRYRNICFTNLFYENEIFRCVVEHERV